jgi:glutathione synthase/RimK-type ligase-like ATP-grasp enzyme
LGAHETPHVLILTGEYDKLPARVAAALNRKGVSSVRFNTDQFPQHCSITIAYHHTGDLLRLRTPDGETDLGVITTVWNRRPVPVQPDPRLRPEDQEFVRHEAQHTVTALFYCLQDRFWVNPYDPVRMAEYKPLQLQVAKSLGFNTPRTVITNEPAQARAFFQTCSHGMIYKTLTPYARPIGGKGYGIFTSRVSERELTSQLDGIAFAPCIFQEYIHKAIELRVTVIGDRIFTSSLDSQSVDGAKDDWRRGVLYGGAPHRPADVPDDLKQRILELLRHLGLVFGCLDLVLTPDGQYVFLEINPNGQWYWVEHQTGLPLLDAFTEMLIQRRPDYRLAQGG